MSAFFAKLLGFFTAALQYLRRLRAVLTTSVASRYRQHWVMLLGEAGAGKSSLVASLSWVREHPDARSASHAGIPNTAWHALPQGVLIDPDGVLSAAAAGTPQATQWRQVLDGISALRPERALDGVVLVVSARSLLAKDAQQRLLVAQDARRQLQSLRSQLGLLLPVYVVVSQCDFLEGFGAYWRVFPGGLRAQMQGWSAGAGPAHDGPAQWIDEAWLQVVQRLKALQIEAAAVQDRIGEADAFFLHPRHFEQLRTPARQYLAEVFQDTSWEQAFLCRGVYFTGNVQPPAEAPKGARADIAFVDQLVQDKVLKEQGLARVARRALWSRDRTLRSLQQAGLVLATALTLALGAAAWRLDRQVEALAQAVAQMRQSQAAAVAVDPCIGKPALDAALARAASMDAHLVYFTMPLSLFDRRAGDNAVQAVSALVMARTVYPAISCALRQRAEALNTALPQPPQGTLAGMAANGSDYARTLATLQLQSQAVQNLELNLRRFEHLMAVPSGSAKFKLQTLNQLSEYLFSAPLPPAALAGDGAVAQALVQVPYSSPVPLPPRMRASFARQLEGSTVRLQKLLLDEVAAGPMLLARLEARSAPLTGNASWFTSWLAWVSQSWLPSNPNDNPCINDARALDKLLRPLVDSYQYPPSLLAALPWFASTGCYQPAMSVLQAMQMAPYGPVAIARGGTLVLNPELNAEVRGFTALLPQTYMQVARPQPFACVKSAPGWRTVDIGKAESYVREFQQFTASQALAPWGAAPARRPLYLRVGTHQLELVMNDALRSAQASSGAPEIVQGLDAVSAADQQLLEQSGEFARGLQPLLTTLRLYTQMGFGKSGSVVAQCARDFASSALARVSTLADQSRLYEPEAGPPDGTLVSLGSTPVVRDYLGRQVARAQVLTGYADPFAALLRNTDGVNDAQRANTQSLPYWTNTINQLNGYVQFKEPAGQVGALDTLFLKTVADLTYANCAKQLAGYQPPDEGNDLFSGRRKSLVKWLRSLCGDRQATISADAYQRLANRFNTELAGSYPFGALDSVQEASLGTAKAFFVDYDANRAALEASLAGMDRAQWKSQLDFVAQLDKAAAFLRGSLTATPSSQPMRLSVTFRVLPGAAQGAAANVSPGSDQIVGWTLSAGPRVIAFPSLNPPTLDWPFGQALELNLNWADRSVWRPVPAPTIDGLAVDGATASFASSGDWALLRMLERFKPRLVSGVDPANPNRALLEFQVPVTRIDGAPANPPPAPAVMYLGLSMAANDAKGPAPVPVAWPGYFPRTAPPAPTGQAPTNQPRGKP